MNIALFGGGLHTQYCIDIIEKDNKYNIVGIIDPALPIGSKILEYEIIGSENQLPELISQYDISAGLITVGDNWTRKIIYEKIIEKKSDFKFVNAFHPSTIIGRDVTLGVGIVTMAGCIINPYSTVGNFCFFATGAQLEHHCIIHDYASISAGSITGGKVSIGKYSAIALGVTVMDRLNIGENTVVGSGSLVLKDLPDNVLAYGNPAKIIRTRKAGEKFLK